MTDQHLPGRPANLKVTVPRAELVLTWTQEHWQFFAFVFAALVTLAFTLLDECVVCGVAWRAGAKLVTFFMLAYLTLVNETVKARLVLLLLWLTVTRR